MLKDFKALLNNIPHTTHRVAIYSGKREFITPNNGNTTYISDEQLHALELSIHHVIKVQVE
jgi:hypothetical protein